MGEQSAAGRVPEPGRRHGGWVCDPLFTAACAGCGRAGGSAVAVADLAVVWLVPDPRSGEPAATRFCRDCAPDGPVGEVECAGCGDGPLLAGELARPADLVVAGAVDAWLESSGWRPSGPWCPDCASAPTARRA